jgi:hypothetical protein
MIEAAIYTNYLNSENIEYNILCNNNEILICTSSNVIDNYKNPIAIKKMEYINYSGYVYDLTTDNHHFAAGIGSMIVHNTDSVFFNLNLENPETGERHLVGGHHRATYVTDVLKRPTEVHEIV